MRPEWMISDVGRRVGEWNGVEDIVCVWVGGRDGTVHGRNRLVRLSHFVFM